jgi:uncharacterized protein (DUF1684 family)
VTDRRSIADYRMRVADLYAAVRRSGASEASWRSWRAGRDELFRTHAESPLRPVPDGWQGQPFWDYDSTWRLHGVILPGGDAPPIEVQQESGFVERFHHAGLVRFDRLGATHQLPIYWSCSYAGGWFLPFRDRTSGTESFGSGRYLLDQAKAAHLGEVDGRLVLDFNFSFHPSCVWGDWVCPLPPPESTIPVAVLAGEQATS